MIHGVCHRWYNTGPLFGLFKAHCPCILPPLTYIVHPYKSGNLRLQQLCIINTFLFVKEVTVINQDMTIPVVEFQVWGNKTQETCLKGECFKGIFDNFWEIMMASLQNLAPFTLNNFSWERSQYQSLFPPSLGLLSKSEFLFGFWLFINETNSLFYFQMSS